MEDTYGCNLINTKRDGRQVTEFVGIRIHAGNTSEDTEGCILVGKNREVGKVLDSRIWVHRLKQKIVEAKGRGEPVWITIK